MWIKYLLFKNLRDQTKLTPNFKDQKYNLVLCYGKLQDLLPVRYQYFLATSTNRIEQLYLNTKQSLSKLKLNHT